MALLRTVTADGAAETEFLNALRSRAEEVNDAITRTAGDILREVKKNGYNAVCKYSKQFDNALPRELTKEEIRSAYVSCPEGLKEALERAAENIRGYHENMRMHSWEWEREPGALAGQVVRGLSKVGLYVPGGTAAYPSSVLMTAIPAKCAGVEEVILVTPPTENLKPSVLAAAYIAGVDRVIAVGGVQAIAALAYGAGFIPRVDKIVGPGNAYVAAAKRLSYGTVDIDMVAGPSEIMIIADGNVDPAFVAADLLSQAEHDVLASAVLLTDAHALAERVEDALAAQLSTLSRKEIATRSLRDFGGIILCPDLARCAEIANAWAPEHLEIMTKNPRALLPEIKNAGAVFLGAYSPEPLGDYLAGPSHVLPTGGTARFFSPLSVDSFIKKMNVIEYTQPALSAVSEQIIRLTENEGLDAHGKSITRRVGYDEDR